jgi:hypothetical protein
MKVYMLIVYIIHVECDDIMLSHHLWLNVECDFNYVTNEILVQVGCNLFLVVNYNHKLRLFVYWFHLASHLYLMAICQLFQMLFFPRPMKPIEPKKNSS